MSRLFATLFLILTLGSALPTGAAPAAEPFDLQAVRLEHDELTEGQPATFRVVVRNLGPGKAAGVRASVTADGKPLGVLRARGDVRPGQEAVLSGTMTPPAAGPQTLEAVVGPEDGNEANDRVRLEVTVAAAPRPDLQIEDLKVDKRQAVGEETLVFLRVRNAGQVATGGASVRLEAGGKTVASHRLGRHLKPGMGEDLVLKWTPAAEGATVLTAVVDSGDRVQEGDEANNRAEVSVEVAARRLPDLQPLELSLPQDLREGSPSELRVKVANKGEASAYAVPLVLKVGGRTVAERTVRLAIGAGQSRTIPLPWVPDQAGELHLTLEVDPEGRHPDSVPSNNSLQATATVAGRPVPDLQAVRLDAPQEAYAGDRVRVAAVVRNEGELPVFGCRATLLVDGQAVGTGNSPGGIDPGGEASIPLSFTPMVGGTVKLEVRVEVLGTVKETNTSDNQAQAEVVILEPRRR